MAEGKKNLSVCVNDAVFSFRRGHIIHLVEFHVTYLQG